MNTRLFRSIRASAATLLVVGVAVPFLGVLAADSRPSPFLPPGSGAQAAAPSANTPLDRLELRGLMTIGGVTYATFFDTSTSRSFTVEMDQSAEGVKVSDHQVSGDDASVLVESAGQSKRIQLRQAKVATVAAAPMTAPTPTPTPVPPPTVNAPPVATAAMSDEEVRQRMQRVAEEIRRRREMRREMLGNNANGQPGQAAPAPQAVPVR